MALRFFSRRTSLLSFAALLPALADDVAVRANDAAPAPAATCVDATAVRAAILDEPGLPIRGAGSSAERLAAVLAEGGAAVRRIDAAELADPAVLDPGAIDVLVLPTGESFPSPARESVVRFLRGGGCLVTTGGYAFNHLLAPDNGGWISETDRARGRRAEATRKDRSLLSNGDFESSRPLPAPGESAAGQWTRSSMQCTVVSETPQEGRACAQVVVTPDAGDRHPAFFADLRARPGATYQMSGWLRTERIIESGYAYIAVYQYGADDRFIAHNDFAKAWGTTDWTHSQFTFTPGPGVERLQVKFGVYQTVGRAWFDDLRLADVTGTLVRPMNTSTGVPADGLVTTPEQMGLFDASYPLKRVRRLGTAGGQRIVTHPLDIHGEFTGWAASGVTGHNSARWIPLLTAFDRYDRPRGPAAAMLLHYGGYYAGSLWAYFGIDSCDLFGRSEDASAEVLRDVVRFMARKTFLRNFVSSRWLYRSGERPELIVVVDNRGRRPRSVAVRFAVAAAGAGDSPAFVERSIVVEAGSAETARAVVPAPDERDGLCRATATLLVDGEPVDEMATGFVFERRGAPTGAPPLRFEKNYFTLDGRPVFLFGTDTYNETYKSAYENPLTWWEGHVAGRDIGLNLYENLQYVNTGHTFSDAEWRSFEAMKRLVQQCRLVFMPGMLIGHNVAVGDEQLAEQSALCREYARRFQDTPTLLYYINGDYQMNLGERPAEVKALWNRWLAEKYETTAKLRAAWGPAAVTAELGGLDFWPPDSGRWDDVAIVDRLRFQNWLTRRWNEAHVSAVRQHDRVHPITSEYYSFGWAGMDLTQTIDGQDVSNIGFFDQPDVDLDVLPLKIRYNDLRARGKGVSLGEYGVKTHPAWSVENGAQHYHIGRTEEQQKQLFMAVAHYAIGLGACKVQNWCLRDAQNAVFPWGLFYPNEHIPKDVAYAHRNQSLIWRFFTPRYVPPPLTLCMPNNQRLGNFEAVGREIVDRASATLLSLHHDFNVIDDHHLADLPPQTRVMVYPSAFAVRDDVYAALLAWVKAGGTLLATGDISYDENRQRTRTERLAELAGVEFVRENYRNIERPAEATTKGVFSLGAMGALEASPCIRVRAAGAEVLGATADGEPILTRHRVGRGTVYLFTDPVELSAEASGLRRSLYRAFLGEAGVTALPGEPDEPWLHVMAQPTRSGTVHVAFDTRKGAEGATLRLPTSAGVVTLHSRPRWPVLALAACDGRLLAASAVGRASVGDAAVMKGTGLKAMLSLDGRDMRTSEAFVVAPFEEGFLERALPGGGFVAVVGDFRQGRWAPLERIEQGAAMMLPIDADRASCVILVCRPDEESRWSEVLTQAMVYPEKIQGY